MSATAKNLEAIQAAVVKHNGNCPQALEAIEMCQYEVERLGWDDFRGTPIRANEDVPRGDFRLVCSGDHSESRPVVAQGISVDAQAPAETIAA